MKKLCVCLIAVFLVSGCAFAPAPAVSEAPPAYTIGVVLKAMDSQHWMEVRSGIRDAATRLNIQVLVLYPTSESRVREQQTIIEDLLQADIDALIVAPCDSANTRGYVQKAREKNIPVFAMDTAAEDTTIPYIGADNEKIGALAAQHMAELLHNEGSVAVIAGVRTQTSHARRVKGFETYLKDHTMIKVLDIRYADSDFRKAMDTMAQLSAEYPTLDGVFCTSAVMGLGALEQMKMSKTAKTPYIIAVDTQDDAVLAVQNGALGGLVAQNGYEIGQAAVQTVFDALSGAEIAQNTYVESSLLTRESPSAQESAQKEENARESGKENP